MRDIPLVLLKLLFDLAVTAGLPPPPLPPLPTIAPPIAPLKLSKPTLRTLKWPWAGQNTVDALASDAVTTTTPTTALKVSIKMKGLHMTAEEIRESEDKLKQEEKTEQTLQRQEITFRHKAYDWLKQHGNNMETSVCKAAGSFFDFKVLTQLVKMGGSVNKQMCGDDLGTPLHSAASWGLAEGVTRIMRTLGGDPNLCNAKGLPPVYEACAKLQGSSNKETIKALVEGGADLNLEVEGVPLAKLAMQKGEWKVARCLLDAGARWPFIFDPSLRIHGKDFSLPDTPYSTDRGHFHFCEAARTGDLSTVLRYAISGMDVDYGLCWSPGVNWLTSVMGHAAFYRQKEIVKFLKDFDASHKTSEMCKAKQRSCRSKEDCFSCYSPCEAYRAKAKDESVLLFKSKEVSDSDSGISSLLNC